MGSLQGWGGIWRFAYSHGRDAMFKPWRMGYFDLASDPLSQAAERASLCLFLRGDLKPAPHSVVLAMTDQDLAQPAGKIPTLAPKWHWLAWVTRVGTEVAPQASAKDLAQTVIVPLGWATPASAYPQKQVVNLEPYQADDAQVISALEKSKIFDHDSAPRPKDKFFRSETGEITIDGPRNQMILDTARTAGGFAPEGQTIQAPNGGVTVTMRGTDATVWVSAVDDKPIRKSRRLLVTHLTDLQNTGIEYKEPARQTLLAWGEMPHLVRAGKAEVSIRLKSARGYRVWALSPGGKRIGEVPATVGNGELSFTADVAADPAWGARMLYEVVRK